VEKILLLHLLPSPPNPNLHNKTVLLLVQSITFIKEKLKSYIRENMKALKIWKNTLANRAKGTRNQYFHYFNKFLDYAQVSADELREMKYEEDQEAKPWERNRVENLLRGYIKNLEEKNLTCSTQSLAFASVRSFFEAQGMPLNLKKEDAPQGCAFGSKTLTKEEIRQIKNAAEFLRDKALIMFLKDSGLRQSDAAKLRWGDFKDYGEGFWGFQLQTKKKKIKARGFIGPEATEILALYKRKRLEGTQKIPPEKNIEDHPVFALVSEPSKPVKATVMSGTLGKIINLAGIENASPPGLRKFWEQNVHFEHEAYQKQLNGRALDKVERAYHWKETQELFELYRANYLNLRIEKQDLRKATEQLRKEYDIENRYLRERIENLEQENLNLKQRLNGQKPELQKMRNELDELRTMLKRLAEKQT
jgi:integrase